MQFKLQWLVPLTVLLAASTSAAGSDYHVGIGGLSVYEVLAVSVLAFAVIYDCYLVAQAKQTSLDLPSTST